MLVTNMALRKLNAVIRSRRGGQGAATSGGGARICTAKLQIYHQYVITEHNNHIRTRHEIIIVSVLAPPVLNTYKIHKLLFSTIYMFMSRKCLHS
jgi:hypothetical protein